MDLFETQREYYDKRWANEHFANLLQASRCAAILEGVARFELKEPRILDLGCGTGWLSAILGQFGPTIGVDLSEVAIKQASERYPGVGFLAANIMEWPKASELGEFDIVVSQEVIEHVPDRMKYIKTAFDLLKHGGLLLLTTPNARTFAAMPDEVRRTWSDQPFEELLSPKQTKQIVQELFKVVEITTIISGFGAKGTYRIASSYKVGRVLAKTGLKRAFDAACLRAGFGLHTFLVARK